MPKIPVMISVPFSLEHYPPSPNTQLKGKPTIPIPKRGNIETYFGNLSILQHIK